MVTQYHRHVEAVEGMVEAQQLERSALGVAQVVELLDTGAIHHVLDQLGGQDQALGMLPFHLHQRIVQIGVHGDAAVGGQGPGVVVQITAEIGPLPVWPSAQSNLAATPASSTALKRTSMEGSSCRSIPLRLRPARSHSRYTSAPAWSFVQVAVFNDLGHGADDVGFGAKVHGQVGVFPVTQHAQPDEIGLLRFDLGLGVFAALGAELGSGDLLARLADHAFHFQFDGQTVAIPTRHIGGVETGEALGLDDDVFEDLVDRVTDVNAAVRIGGPSCRMNEGLPALARRMAP